MSLSYEGIRRYAFLFLFFFAAETFFLAFFAVAFLFAATFPPLLHSLLIERRPGRFGRDKGRIPVRSRSTPNVLR